MYCVNPDLLQTTPYHADGTARDPHARHAAEHRAARREARRARRQAVFARAVRVLSRLAQSGAPAGAKLPQA
jgi:hypothetical protein